jgi:lambda family phage portal protein
MVYTPLGPVQATGRGVAVGYESADWTRNSGRTLSVAGSGDYHLRYEIDTLRRQSQAFDRNNVIYQALVSRVCDMILGSGWTLQAHTSDDILNAKLEELWRDYWTSPEVRGLDDGAGFCEHVLRALLVDGDVALLKDAQSGKVQIVQADQVTSLTAASDGNRVESGVEVDRYGKPLAFYIADYDMQGLVGGKPVKKPASAVIWLANCRHADQTRGEPAMQAAFPMLHRLNDVCDSEAAAWQLLSRLAVTVSRKDAARLAYATSRADENATAPPDLAGRYHDFGDAIIFHGEPGEEVKGIEHNLPGANFVESTKMFMRLIGMALGFTLEFTLLIWSDTNYSSGRASAKQVERNCGRWIRLLRRALGQLYRWKVSQWVRDGVLGPENLVVEGAAFDALTRHVWHRPPYPFIDPQKELDAARGRLEVGLSSPSMESAETGQEYEDLLRLQQRDLTKLKAVVDEFNNQNPGVQLELAGTAFGQTVRVVPMAEVMPESAP